MAEKDLENKLATFEDKKANPATRTEMVQQCVPEPRKEIIEDIEKTKLVVNGAVAGVSKVVAGAASVAIIRTLFKECGKTVRCLISENAKITKNSNKYGYRLMTKILKKK